MPAGAKLQLEETGARVAAVPEEGQEGRPVNPTIARSQVLVSDAVVVMEVGVEEPRQHQARDAQRVAAAQGRVA